MIGVTGLQPRVNNFPIALESFALVKGALIGIQPQPCHAIENGVDVFLRGALLVGVFDAQHELPVVMAGIEPAEKRRPDTTYMENACWARRESGSYSHEGSLWVEASRC